MSRKQLRRGFLIALISAMIPISLYAIAINWNANFGTITDGELYRSGQMTASALNSTIAKCGIKTVLNLRGFHPEEKWYAAEREVTLANQGVQIDVALSSSEWMSRQQMTTLVDILDRADRPLLIHCFHGAERTGLISAFAELLRDGSTLAAARQQFTLFYLFVPVGDGLRMPEHLDQYEAWLKGTSTSHTPERFRYWARKEYHPGTPSREAWPYDPYPLRVVSRRSNDASRQMIVETEWMPGSEPGSLARSKSQASATSTKR